ncbi:MAG: GNAT family N-acetyltransferase [Bdellovibrionales bacterium]|nr:GNAT family N-acetyltransferase [Bdellovibrionales bacterium]
MEIKIHRATTENAEQIIEFQICMAEETENLQLNPTKVRNGVLAVLEKKVDGEYWVLTDSKSILGCCLLLKEWSDWRCQSVLWIHSVYIRPEERGKGYFKKLYLSLQQMVLDHPEIAGLRLYVDKSNSRAQKIYQTIGMNAEHYDLYEWMRPT